MTFRAHLSSTASPQAILARPYNKPPKINVVPRQPESFETIQINGQKYCRGDKIDQYDSDVSRPTWPHGVEMNGYAYWAMEKRK